MDCGMSPSPSHALLITGTGASGRTLLDGAVEDWVPVTYQAPLPYAHADPPDFDSGRKLEADFIQAGSPEAIGYQIESVPSSQLFGSRPEIFVSRNVEVSPPFLQFNQARRRRNVGGVHD